MKPHILKRLLLIVLLFISSLFSGLFLQEVSAWKYPELESSDNAGLFANLQRAANGDSSRFYGFNAQNLVDNAKAQTVKSYDAATKDGFGSDYPAWLCASPNEHDPAKAWIVSCVMDVDEEGDVTVYTRNSTKKTTLTDSNREAIMSARMMAFCAARAIEKGEHAENGKWPACERLIQQYFIGEKFSQLKKLGVPNVMRPDGAPVGTYNEATLRSAKEAVKDSAEYVYKARFVFMNGSINGVSNGQDALIFRGDEVKKKVPKIRLIKENTKGEKLKGAKCRVDLVDENHKVIKNIAKDVAITEGNRLLSTTNIQVGKIYKFTETTAPKGYLLDDTPKFAKPTKNNTVNSNAIKITFKNKRKPWIEIKKVDSTNSNKKISGAKFSVYSDIECKEVVTSGTITDGTVKLTKNLEIGKTYYVKETKAPTGYKLNSQIKSIKIKEGENKISFTNTPYNKLKLLKVDQATGKALPGAVFRFRKRENGQDKWLYIKDDGTEGYTTLTRAESVKTEDEKKRYDASFFKTKSDGSITLNKLNNKATLTAFEWTAPTEYEIPTELSYPEGRGIQISITNPLKTVTVKNKKEVHPNTLKIKKIDNETSQPLAGAVFRIKNTTRGDENYNKYLYKKADNTYGYTEYQNEESLQTQEQKNIYKASLFTTGKDGYIKIELTEAKQFVAYEIKAPDGYKLLENPINISREDIEIGSTQIVNNIKEESHYVRFIKLNSTNNQPIQNVIFKIKKTGTEQYLQPDGTLSSSQYEFKTNSDGEVFVGNVVDKGPYTAIETIPQGYTGNSTQTALQIDTKDPVIIYNQPNDKLLTKVIEDTNGLPLDNILFGIKNWEPDDAILRYDPGPPPDINNYQYFCSEEDCKGHYYYSAYQADYNRWATYLKPGYEYYKRSQTSYVSTAYSVNGQIRFENFRKDGSYTLYEIRSDNPYFVVEPENKEIMRGYRNSTQKEISNSRKYVNIEGYVFVDNVEGKTSGTNGLYDNGEGVNGVKVILERRGQVIAEVSSGFQTGTRSSPKSQSTGQVGLYRFLGDKNNLRIEADYLDEYVVKFQYNGILYSCIPNIYSQNEYYSKSGQDQESYKKRTSKAKENELARREFNEDYSTVTANGPMNQNGISTNIAKSSNKYHDDKLITYQYDNNSHTSTAIYNSSDPNYSSHYYADVPYRMESSTNRVIDLSETGTAGGYPYDPSNNTIQYINLGLSRNELPDVALVSTLDSAEVSLNGYAHRYLYNNRSPFMNDAFNNIQIKASDEIYNKTLNRELYESDVEYSKEKYEKEDRERAANVYLTYKIVLRNQSSSIDVRVNEVVNYFDENFNGEFVQAGLEITDKQSITPQSSEQRWVVNNKLPSRIAKEFDGYNTAIIETGNYRMGVGESLQFYVQYKIKLESLITLSKDHSFDVHNIFEVNECSASKNGAGYLAIDADSAVGNSIPSKKDETLEDDTDWAEAVKVMVTGDKRTISGIVFEDSTPNTFLTNSKRQGDGEYRDGEKKISNIKVSLVDIDTGEVAKEYKEENDEPKDIKYTSKENGEYIIESFIPGNYVVVYTYGNGTQYIAQQYQATIYQDKARAETNYRGQKEWYKQNVNSRYSDAIDNYSEENNSMQSMRGIYHINENVPYGNTKTRKEIETVWNEGYDVQHHTHSTQVNSAIEIDAYTACMGIGVEENECATSPNDMNGKVYRLDIKNVDFGIVERPRYKVQVDKKINRIILKKNDGSVLKDIQPEKNIIPASVTYIKSNDKNDKNISTVERGFVEMSIDTEILQGAQMFVEYLVKVTNRSELEYNTYDYYQFGIRESNDQNIVRVSVPYIMDYVDNQLKFDEKSHMLTDENKDETNEKWTKLDWSNHGEIDRLLAKGKNSSNNQTIRENLSTNNGCKYDTILYGRSFEFANMKPGEQKDTRLVLQTNLSATQKRMNYENFMEVVEVTKPWGREIYAQDTDNAFGQQLGNFDITETEESAFEFSNNEKGAREPDVAYSEKIIIHPPTGNEMNYVFVIIIVGICVLVVTAITIIYIKKRKFNKF